MKGLLPTGVLSSTGPVIQVFNQYLEAGGEEAWVRKLAEELRMETCYFHSVEWRGPDAPSAWRQALLMIDNPSSRKRLREFQAATGASAWLLHNVFPVGSAAIYKEALHLRVPVIQYIHNFRPFTVSGYLQPEEAKDLGNMRRMYWREISKGAWQNSHVKTAWFAFVLTLSRAMGWFRAIKVWIAVSDFMRDQFIVAGVPAEDIYTLRHYWRPMPEAPIPKDEGYFVFLGRLIAMKGVGVLLDAWDLLHQKHGAQGPRLMIAGDGEMTETVIARAQANPLITYCGHIAGEEKQRLLHGCSGIIAPSLCFESLGLVVYEAYDFSKPVLAARSGGLAETVQHNVTGLIHEPGDGETLANQVIDLSTDPAKRKQMGRAGREWLMENASFARWKDGFKAVIEHAKNAMHDG